MAKGPAPLIATDDQVRALLERYQCLVPFHEVRTRFLGNIATPDLEVTPIKIIESLWGGSLPPFDTIDAANELFGVLVMGLWNRLSKHQDRTLPFRLTRIDTKPTRRDLVTLALMRRQELDGFIEGLFGPNAELDLPERARRGLDALAEMRVLFDAVVKAAGDEAMPGTQKDMEKTLRLLGEITKNAELEIHAIVRSCVRARQQFLSTIPAFKPTLH
jgi:hypothetical protein